MKVLVTDPGLKLKNAGRKLLVAAEELVQQPSRGGRKVSVGRDFEHIHEFLIVRSLHGTEHMSFRGAA